MGPADHARAPLGCDEVGPQVVARAWATGDLVALSGEVRAEVLQSRTHGALLTVLCLTHRARYS